MDKLRKLNDTELLSICKTLIKESDSENSDLSTHREKALDYYFQRRYGNEVQDRSQVVTSEVADTVESVLSFLVEMFASSDEIFAFEPTDEQDELQAEQETDYVNHVIHKENRGFLIKYTGIKDALLQKNGILKVYWDESDEVTKESYQGLNELELTELANDPEVEIVEQDEYLQESIQLAEGIEIPGSGMVVYDVEVERTRTIGKVQIDNVPPEEFVNSKRATSIFPSDSHFINHRTKKTASDLVLEGFDKAQVYDAVTIEWDDSREKIARDYINEIDEDLETSSDWSTREIQVDECYLQVDYDGDGIAELRKVTIFGNKVRLNEEIDYIPFISLTPNIITHNFYGYSIADQVMDIQLIRSTILRQALDNMYNMNNMRIGAGENVNLDDLLTARPGGVVRTENGALPGQELFPMPVQPFIDQSLGMFEMMDRIMQSRTGVNENMQGLNNDLVNDTAHGVERLLTLAEKKMVLIGLIMAEGFKDLYLKTRELLVKYQDNEKQVKLRSGWQSVNPSQWKSRTNMTINIVSAGERARLIALLQEFKKDQIMAAQAGMVELVNPKKMYNLQEKVAKLAGLPGIEAFFVDPDSQEAQQKAYMRDSQPKQNPLAEAEMVKAQGQLEIEKLKTQYRSELELLKIQSENEKDVMKAQMDSIKKSAELQTKEAIAILEQEVKLMIEGIKADIGQPGLGAEIQ